MNKQAGVKCERFEEPRKKSYPLTLPIATVVVCAAGLFWVYNHVSGGCLELSDVFSYCQFHTK